MQYRHIFLFGKGVGMSLHDFTMMVADFAHRHEHWLLLLLFMIAFLESLAVIAMLFPGTILIVALSTVAGTIDYPFLPIWIATALGAFLGMWGSYDFGTLHKDEMNRLWPFSKKPTLLPRVQSFIHKWGLWAVFFCRFLAPFRATIPMISGAFMVSKWRYQLLNALSAMAWSLLVLSPGTFGAHWLLKFIS